MLHQPSTTVQITVLGKKFLYTCICKIPSASGSFPKLWHIKLQVQYNHILQSPLPRYVHFINTTCKYDQNNIQNPMNTLHKMEATILHNGHEATFILIRYFLNDLQVYCHSNNSIPCKCIWMLLGKLLGAKSLKLLIWIHFQMKCFFKDKVTDWTFVICS